MSTESMRPSEAQYRLSAIRLRESVVTPGPWDCTHYDMESALVSVHIGAEHICFVPTVSCVKPPNGLFIAHARADIPFLLDQLAAAQKEIERLEAVEKSALKLTTRASLDFIALKQR